MPERLHTDRKLIGTKQVLKALKAGRVAAVYVADDADPTEYLRYFGIKYMLHSSNNPRKEEQHAYF